MIPKKKNEKKNMLKETKREIYLSVYCLKNNKNMAASFSLKKINVYNHKCEEGCKENLSP